MDYSSVQAIIDAGITNMECLRNNIANDDGTDTVTGVSWFTYKGNVATNIYVSGNSWLGFGTTSEHLRINRRDTKLWYLYREEGTICNHNFLKIRWKGNSPYDSTDESSQMEYDVILFDDMTIVVHMIKFSSTNDGSYSLDTLSYSVNQEVLNATFYLDDDGNYSVSYKLPTFYQQKYLIRVGSEVFTKDGDTLKSLGEVAVTSTLFSESGFDKLPTSADLVSLHSPEVLYWVDDATIAPKLRAHVNAIANSPQTIIATGIDLTDPTITGIEKAVVDCDGDFVCVVSFDNQITWKAWNGTQWSIISEITEGMNKATLEGVTFQQWQELYEGATSFCIRITLNDRSQVIRKITFDFAN